MDNLENEPYEDYGCRSKIETERLFIRRPTEADVDECFKNIYSDESMNRFQDWLHCAFKSEAGYYMDFDPFGDYWILVLKDTNQIAGYVCFEYDSYPHLDGMSIGWALGSKFQHKGYMTEAVGALTKSYLSGEQGRNVDYIQCQFNENNEGSAGICKRVGFVEEARLKNRRVDLETEEVCSLVICTLFK